jgi:hypothetical protein
MFGSVMENKLENIGVSKKIEKPRKPEKKITEKTEP